MEEEKLFGQVVSGNLFYTERLKEQIRYHQYSINNCYNEFVAARNKIKNFLVQSTLGFKAYLFVEEQKSGRFNRIDLYWGIWKRLKRETSLCFTDKQEISISGDDKDVLLGICNFTPELAEMIYYKGLDSYVILVQDDKTLFTTITQAVRKNLNSKDSHLELEGICHLLLYQDAIVVQYMDCGEDIALNYYYLKDSLLKEQLNKNFIF